MARTPSTMLPLGTIAPDAISGQMLSLQSLKSEKATLIMFICNHCPYVKHIQTPLVSLAKEYQAQGVSVIAINSNDVENYPEDSPEKMKEVAKQWGYPFPYLFDESQSVARAYQAACTPDFYIFDKNLKCVYRGQLDDSRPQNGLPVTGKDIREALSAILLNVPVDEEQKPSLGCNIKWKETF